MAGFLTGLGTGAGDILSAQEAPSFKGEPVPQGDVEAICTTTGCHVSVLQQ